MRMANVEWSSYAKEPLFEQHFRLLNSIIVESNRHSLLWYYAYLTPRLGLGHRTSDTLIIYGVVHFFYFIFIYSSEYLVAIWLEQ